MVSCQYGIRSTSTAPVSVSTNWTESLHPRHPAIVSRSARVKLVIPFFVVLLWYFCGAFVAAPDFLLFPPFSAPG